MNPPIEGVVHLSFDDGPSTYTEQISRLLSDHGHRATFFLLGSSIGNHPEAIDTMKNSGHGIGYHGHAHLDGWKTDNRTFKEDFQQSASLIDSRLYRPPYGRLTCKQYRRLRGTHKVVMWDLMPGDFKSDRSVEDIRKDILRHAKSGSIIVLHDNDDCGAKVLDLLPLLLDGFQKKGLRSEALSSH